MEQGWGMMVYSGKSVQGLYNNTVHVQVILERWMVMWKGAVYEIMMAMSERKKEGNNKKSFTGNNEDDCQSLLCYDVQQNWSQELREKLTLIHHWARSSSILFRSLPAVKEVLRSSFFPIVQRHGQTMSSHPVDSTLTQPKPSYTDFSLIITVIFKEMKTSSRPESSPSSSPWTLLWIPPSHSLSPTNYTRATTVILT